MAKPKNFEEDEVEEIEEKEEDECFDADEDF